MQAKVVFAICLSLQLKDFVSTMSKNSSVPFFGPLLIMLVNSFFI